MHFFFLKERRRAEIWERFKWGSFGWNWNNSISKGQYAQKAELWVGNSSSSRLWILEIGWSSLKSKSLVSEALKPFSVNAEIFTVAVLSKLQLIWAARRDFRQICNVRRRSCHNIDWSHVGRLVLCATTALPSRWDTEEKPHTAVRRVTRISPMTTGVLNTTSCVFLPPHSCSATCHDYAAYVSFCLHTSIRSTHKWLLFLILPTRRHTMPACLLR